MAATQVQFRTETKAADMIIPRDKGRWPARARCRQRIDRVLGSERFRTLADHCGMGRLDVATQHASSVAHILGRPDSLLPEAVDVSIIQSPAAGATGGGGLPVAWLAATRWTSALRNKRLTLRDITRDIRDLGRERDWHTPSSGGLGGRFSPHRATRRADQTGNSNFPAFIRTALARSAYTPCIRQQTSKLNRR
jgi:hypothetical protein